MSANIKPLSFASFVATNKAAVKPQHYASYLAPKQANIKPLIFATYNPPEKPETSLDITITPAKLSVTSQKPGQINLSPFVAITVYRNPGESFVSNYKPQLVISTYRPPSETFISHYTPQTAVSFIPPAPLLPFPLWPQKEWLFFPPELVKFAWHGTKKLTWQTQKEKAGSGKTRTVTSQLLPMITIETKLAHLTDAQTQILFDFIRKVNGAEKEFLWFDDNANTVTDKILPRDSFGHYRLPVHPLNTDYVEYITYADNLTVTMGEEELPLERFILYNGVLYILDENGREIKTDLPEIRASFRYYWRVHFADDGQGIERIFYDFNRSQTLKMEVVR